MRIGLHIFMKDRITPADMVGVIQFIDEVKDHPKDKILAFVNTRKVIRLLTTRRWLIGPWDFYYLRKIIDAAGMTGADTVQVDNVKERIEDLGAFLASHLGGTGWQILSNILTSEVEKHVKAIALKKLEGYMAMVKAHHLPKEMLQDIDKEYKGLDKNYQSRVNMIVEENKKLENEIKGTEPIQMILAASIRA